MHQKPRFLDILSAPSTLELVIVRPTRLEDFARGQCCSIVCPSAPLPLTVQQVETILNLVIVLPKIPQADHLGLGALLVTFPAWEK